MRCKWNAQSFEKFFNLFALNVPKPLCFHDLNISQNQNCSNDENNPNDENEDDIFD